MSTFPSDWKTARTRVSDVRAAAAEELAAIFNASGDSGVIDPSFRPVSSSDILRRIRDSEESADQINGFRMQAIRLAASDATVGYFHFFQGTPRPDVVVLSMFVVHPRYRSVGIGVEVVEGWFDQLSRLSRHRGVWGRVYLRNCRALSFWTSHRFTRLIPKDGEYVRDEGDGHVSVVVERTLAQGHR